jgi:CheY-like chemotaxis protein
VRDDAMLRNVDPRIGFCLHSAVEARRLAEQVTDQIMGREFPAWEEGCAELARSEELSERLGRYCASRRPAATSRSPVGLTNCADRTLAFVENHLVAIVDDDLHAREGLNELVQSLGHMSAAFASAEDYLGSKPNGDAACLILDVNLPGMSGPDLQTRLIDDGCCTPVIFLTGRFDETVRSRVLRAGALGYLTKPCDERELSHCIEKALENRLA